MKAFFALIDQINRNPDQKDALEAVIWQTFGVEKAVLALDMSGFSLTVRRQGILAYLARIRRMQAIALPLVRECGGDMVKCDADNLMAVFDACDQAVHAAVRINQACHAAGQPVSIGIDVGRILLIPDTDCFGDAVNLAYKLGEDLAAAGEVLITDKVHGRIPPGTVAMTQELLSVAGIDLQVWHIGLNGV